jgi:hypothetical protein
MKEKETVGSPFLGAFHSDRIPKMTKGVSLHSLLIVAIPVNYTRKFQELFEDILCIDTACLLKYIL